MKNRAAFSLIELLVALSILAVVSAIILPRFLDIKSSAKLVVLKDLQKNFQEAYDKWSSMGGSLTGADPYERACACFQLLVLPSGRTSKTAGASTASDSAGSMGSGVIVLGGFNAAYSTGGPLVDLQKTPNWNIGGFAPQDHGGKLYIQNTGANLNHIFYCDLDRILHCVQLDANGVVTVSM